MFSVREIASLSAALTFWSEEMLPHGRAIMEPYFRQLRVGRTTPLNRREIGRLQQRLRRELKRNQ